MWTDCDSLKFPRHDVYGGYVRNPVDFGIRRPNNGPETSCRQMLAMTFLRHKQIIRLTN